MKINRNVIAILLIAVFTCTALYSQTDSATTTIVAKKDTSASKGVQVNILPYPFYSNLFKFGLGGFMSVTGLFAENSLLKVGGFVSTNASFLGYLQYEEFQIPGIERLFFRPDLLFGKVGKVRNFSELGVTIPGRPVYTVTAGTNESDENNYFEVDGFHQWYEFTFGYLLPIGYGKKHIVAHPVLEHGILMDGATGGWSLSPFDCGRTFLQTKIIYRRLDMTFKELNNLKMAQTSSGAEFILNLENVDYNWNPTRGYIAKFSYLTDWKLWGGDNDFDMLKTELSVFVPLSEKNDKSPSILAFDFKTAHTLNWNAYDINYINAGGVLVPMKVYHRPPNFAGAFLGGPRTMRGYLEYRFFDCSSIFYCAEFRQVLKWNPFDYWGFTRSLGVDWIELAAFAEMGRVAPYWQLKLLHKDMKWDVGTGLRLFFDGFLVRVDFAYGKEGGLLQMFYDYSF